MRDAHALKPSFVLTESKWHKSYIKAISAFSKILLIMMLEQMQYNRLKKKMDADIFVLFIVVICFLLLTLDLYYIILMDFLNPLI